MRVLNFGSLNYDYVYNVDHIMMPGETQASTGMNTFCGGKGLNQSIALAKAGVPVYHAGMVGEDGTMFLNLCKENNVDTTYTKTIAGKSGHTIIQVDRNAQNCILLYGGANRSITKEFVDEVLAGFEEGDLILLQNEVNEMPYIIEQAYEKKMMIALNPSPYDHALDDCDFHKVSIFLMNEIEGEMMTGFKDPDQILTFMKKEFPEAKVVLTLGGDGVRYQDKEQSLSQGIFKVQAVDTTAAGDTFTGYFISGLLQEMPIQNILERCAKASSIAVSRMGATDSIPRAEEVDMALDMMK